MKTWKEVGNLKETQCLVDEKSFNGGAYARSVALVRLVEKVERACVCWRTNQNFMKAEDWRELETLVKEAKEALCLE